MINNFHGTSLTSASFYFYILEATAYVLPCSTCQHALMDRWVYAYLNVGNFRVHDFHWHTFKITLFFLLEHILNTWSCAHAYAYISIRKINNKAGKNYLVKTLSYFFWWGIFFFICGFQPLPNDGTCWDHLPGQILWTSHILHKSTWVS